MSRKIGGCVILYNPDSIILNNIATFKTHIEPLLIVDNSPEQDIGLVDRIKELHSEATYSWMGENKGIASALNIACEFAIQKDCEWLLTMDQDSRFKEADLLKMVASIDEAIAIYKKPGIICPYHNIHDWFSLRDKANFQKIRSTMTSGNLVNLAAYRMISGFDERYFIDYVDHEYCLRLRKNGFSIIQNNKILLEHSLGNFELRRFFWKRFGISNHNHIRRYYITRNGLCTVKRYFFRSEVLYENNSKPDIRSGAGSFFEKNKLLKFRAMMIGIGHAVTNRLGKYEPGT